MLRSLQQWWSARTAAPVASTYSDQHVATLATLRDDLRQAQQMLVREQGVWDSLAGRTDPDAHHQKTMRAPGLLDLQARVAQLTDAVAATEQRVEANWRAFEQYAALTEQAQGEVRPVLDALPDEARVQHLLALSLDLDRLAQALLQGTGDRQFRRPRVDPYRAIRTAAEALLVACDRARSLRAVAHKAS